jgi:hypothetical protein
LYEKEKLLSNQLLDRVLKAERKLGEISAELDYAQHIIAEAVQLLRGCPKTEKIVVFIATNEE